MDIDKVVKDNFSECKIVHKERKNLGMTYVYIIENSPPEPEPNTEDKETSETNEKSAASDKS